MATGREAEFGRAVRAALLMNTCPLSLWDIIERRDVEGDTRMTGYSILWRLVPYAAAVLIGILAYLHLQSLERERDAALAAQAATMQALGTESAAKRALTAALVASNSALAERDAAQRVLDRRLAERRGNLEDSIRAPEAQPWAAARMPPDVYRGLRAARANRHDESAGGDAAAVTPRRD